jgi:hypothetical protein
MNSESELSGFRGRLEVLIGTEQPFAWAKRIGLPGATFDRMWNGNGIPKGNHLLTIARSCGVTVDWLLTGEGNMRPGPAAPRLPQTTAAAERDADLYGRVLEAISAVYKEVGWVKTLHQLGAEAAQIADDLAADGLLPEDKPGAVKGAATQLRRQLRQAIADPNAPASTKERA